MPLFYLLLSSKDSCLGSLADFHDFAHYPIFMIYIIKLNVEN